MTRYVLHIISGIPPGPSGTGRLLAHLIAQKAAATDWDVRFHFPLRPAGSRRQMIRERYFLAAGFDWLRVGLSWIVLRVKLRWLTIFANGSILVFHPQTLGFHRVLRLLHAWRGRAFLYGLDNSFFCVRSYNHVPGESQPCLRCLGGHFEAAGEQACTPFPVPDNRAFTFVRDLFKLLSTGEICVLTQNQDNADLYRRHIGDKVQVQVVGLWTSDWTELFDTHAPVGSEEGYDVVFHGFFVAAKGAEWMLEVARHMPQTQFLFPTSLPVRFREAPDNITFKPMTWESGLDIEIIKARIVCVPSLWSATIEGALIKSIMFGRATARVRVPSAYGDELPEGLVLNLDPDPVTAARQLGEVLESGWSPDPALCEAWIRNFQTENFEMLDRILRAIERSVKRTLKSNSLPEVDRSKPEPVSDHGLRLEKLGTAYGGWTVPVECIDQNWTCYCVGAGEDISFDCSLIERFNSDVYVFDPTPRAIEHIAEFKRRIRSGQSMPINNNPDVLYTLPKEKLNRLHFYPYGVWSENTTQKFYAPKNSSHVSHSILNLQGTEDYFDAECRTLSSLMQKFGHTHIDLLKLDVEGAEYKILQSMLVNGITPRVLCVEFDEGNLPLDSGAPKRISEMIKALKNNGFVFVQQDGWNTIFIHEDAQLKS